MEEAKEVILEQGNALPNEAPTTVEQAPTVTPEINKSETPATIIEKKKITPMDAVRKASESLAKGSLSDNKSSTELSGVNSAPEGSEIKAPEHWPNEFKDGFRKLKDPESRQLYMEAVKNVEAAHTKRSQEFAPYKELDKFWEPYKQVGSPVQALQYYMNIEQGLNTNPVESLKYLAKQYNVPLEKLVGDGRVANTPEGDEEFVDPAVSKLEQRFAQLEQLQYQRQVSEVQAQINAIKMEKDTNGGLKYPHFDALEPEMIRLKKAGLGESIPELYEKALYLNTDLRQQVEAEKISKKIAEQEAARKADIDKAKRAATHLNGAAPAQSSTRAKTPAEAVAMARRQLSTN